MLVFSFAWSQLTLYGFVDPGDLQLQFVSVHQQMETTFANKRATPGIIDQSIPQLHLPSLTLKMCTKYSKMCKKEYSNKCVYSAHCFSLLSVTLLSIRKRQFSLKRNIFCVKKIVFFFVQLCSKGWMVKEQSIILIDVK